jgi:branched-subunit amino acid aminotransferase/4-amino-4-deoxychorismate lyase
MKVQERRLDVDDESTAEVMCVEWKIKVQERRLDVDDESTAEVICVEWKMKVQERRLDLDDHSTAEVVQLTNSVASHIKMTSVPDCRGYVVSNGM